MPKATFVAALFLCAVCATLHAGELVTDRVPLGNGYDRLDVRWVADGPGECLTAIDCQFTPVGDAEFFQQHLVEQTPTPYAPAPAPYPELQLDTHFLFDEEDILGRLEFGEDPVDGSLRGYFSIYNEARKQSLPFAQIVVDHGVGANISGVFANGQGTEFEFGPAFPLPISGGQVDLGGMFVRTDVMTIGDYDRITLYMDATTQESANAFDVWITPEPGHSLNQWWPVSRETPTPFATTFSGPSPEMDTHFTAGLNDILSVMGSPEDTGTSLSATFDFEETGGLDDKIAQLIVPAGRWASVDGVVVLCDTYEEVPINAIVPEPATLLLLGFGAAGILRGHRR